MKKTIITAFLSLNALVSALAATSQDKPLLNEEWRFIKRDAKLEAVNSDWQTISIPHTYNAIDASNGGGKDMQSRDGYYRGPATYLTDLNVPTTIKDKRVFIRFEAVSSVADVYINQKHVGQHKGAFAAFCYEITDYLQSGKNEVRIKTDNSFRWDIAPLSGDFPMFGGIYRPVKIMVKKSNCISPLNYASSGIYIRQKKVTDAVAEIEMNTKLSLKGKSSHLKLKTEVIDAKGRIITQKETEVKAEEVNQAFTIKNPTLWDGLQNPYLYRVKVSLKEAGKVIDSHTEPLGLRSFYIDAQKGFFLNGKPYRVYGVNRHQDMKGKGWALTKEDHKKDLAMIMEIGARGVRLAHYPHSSDFYSLCDQSGLLVWAELPLVDCVSDKPGFAQNARQQTLEMIYQHYNNPSIFSWSLFNEMYHRPSTNAIPLLKELHDLCKKEDPQRLTVGGTNRGHKELCNVTDILAFNGYPGWYGGGPTAMTGYLEAFQKHGNNRGIAVSEYGAGASIHHHQYNHRSKPTAKWHPEEWQAYVHEENYRSIKNTPYCWGSFVWNMFDFASVWRSEGDAEGMNDKGLVTYDRKHRKDAFYFYKTNWNSEPLIHLTAKRFVERKEADTLVKAYSNSGPLELFINGKSQGIVKPDDITVCRWRDVKLKKGKNQVLIKSAKNTALEDSAVWTLR